MSMVQGALVPQLTEEEKDKELVEPTTEQEEDQMENLRKELLNSGMNEADTNINKTVGAPSPKSDPVNNRHSLNSEHEEFLHPNLR